MPIILISCTSITSGRSSSDNLISGHIHANGLGACQILGGRNTEKVGCEIKRADDGVLFVELNVKEISKNQIPSCIFDGFSPTNKMKNNGPKIETINTLISTSQIWISLPSIKQDPIGGDLLMQFICIL